MVRWLDRHWAAVASLLVGGSAIAAMVAKDSASALEFGGVAVSAIVGLWTVEFLRRDFIASHRPFLGITAAEVSSPDHTGNFLLTLHLKNVGGSPGAIVREFATHTIDGVDNELMRSKTERNVIYPGEDVTLVYGTKPGARVLWGCEYADLGGRRPYEFSIEYELEAPTRAIIDILYELAPGSRLGWDIEDLADELTQLLGRRVDLISRNALHQRLRDEVLAEARLLYAA
jgi:hypothetical protein